MLRLSLLAVLSVTILNGFMLISHADDPPQQFLLPDSDEGLPGAGPVRRYDWFRRLWQQRRSLFSQEIKSKQGAVVFLGDSITQGWKNDLQKNFPAINAANRGISGDTTRGMLIRLEEDVFSLNPAGVVMLMGTNDLEEKASPQTIAANIGLILDRIADHNPAIPVVVCQVFPSSSSKSRPANSIKTINKLLLQETIKHPQVTLLDTWSLFANSSGDARKQEFPDLLHPNQTGYRMWASALRPILETKNLIPASRSHLPLESGYRWLFNGQDLSGWRLQPTSEQMKRAAARWQKNDPNAPEWPIVTEALPLDGRMQSPDGRYQVISDRLVVTIPPAGRKIQQIWTTEKFAEDFTLKLEFRATPNADSGIFIRGRQLQCRDFLIAGPYKKLKKFRPQDWNTITIKVSGQTARCTCNGEILETDFKVPKSGPIGLEGDRGQVEYRNIRILMP